MSTTVLGIYNGALSAIRAKGRLSSLSDDSREREECDIWYSLVRDRVQEAAYWPGSRRTARLALIQKRDSSLSWAAGDPETTFNFAYALPSDYLRAWHLIDYTPFTISFDGTRNIRVLSTNNAEAILVYAGIQDNPVHWTPGQREATIYALAGSIAGPISGQNSLQQLNYQLADEKILSARSDAQMANPYQTEALPPALAARGFEDPFRTKYYYPFGPLFAEASP